MYKKIISSILCILIILQCVGNSAFAKGEDSILQGLGILGRYSDDSKVTRAEYAEAVCRLFGYDIAENSKSAFSDVADENSAAIMAVVQRGYLMSSGDKFYPNYFIKAYDAVEMLLDKAGYRYANSGNYMDTAVQYGMLGKSVNPDDALTWQDFGKMLEKYMNLDYFADNYNANGNYTSKGSVKEELLKIKSTTGVMTANQKGSILGEEKEEYTIEINAVEYKDWDLKYQNLLGYKVTAYFRETDEGDELICVVPDKGNNEITLYPDNIVSCSDYTMKYKTESGSSKTLKIDTRADVIYNGCARAGWDFSELEIKRGNITFVDNDNDGDYDLINVVTYYLIFVESINTKQNSVINAFDSNEYVFDSEDSDNEYIFRQNGRKIEFNNIEKDSILSVYESGNSVGKKYVEIDMSINFTEGTVTAFDEDYISIDNQQYQYDDSTVSGIGVGDTGTFYMDSKNRVAAFVSEYAGGEKSVSHYAYFYKGGVIDDEKAYIKLVNLSGKLEKYELAKNVKLINGGNKKSVSGTEALEDSYMYDGSNYIQQLIMYRTNAYGQICEIHTAYNSCVGKNYGRNDDYFSLDIIMEDGGNEASSYYKSDYYKLFSTKISDPESACYVSTNTKALVIPRSISTGIVQENSIEVLSGRSIPSYDGRECGYEPVDGVAKFYCSDGLVYDCDKEFNIASIIILFKDDEQERDSVLFKKWRKNTEYMIITDLGTRIDKYGDIEYTVTGAYSFWGPSKEYILKDRAIEDLANARPGDIIRFYDNKEYTEMYGAQVVFSLKNPGGDALGKDQYGIRITAKSDANTGYAVATVKASKDGVFILEGPFAAPETYFMPSYGYVWIMDCRGKNVVVTKGTTDDVCKGDKVFINQREHQIRDIVVILD